MGIFTTSVISVKYKQRWFQNCKMSDCVHQRTIGAHISWHISWTLQHFRNLSPSLFIYSVPLAPQQVLGHWFEKLQETCFQKNICSNGNYFCPPLYLQICFTPFSCWLMIKPSSFERNDISSVIGTLCPKLAKKAVAAVINVYNNKELVKEWSFSTVV